MSAHAALGTAIYDVTIYPPGENVGGRLVVGEPQTVQMALRIQSKTDGTEQYRAYSEVHRLRLDSAIKIFGGDVLPTESADGLTPAARLTYRGRVYEVVRCDDNRNSVLPHVYSEALETQEPVPGVAA